MLNHETITLQNARKNPKMCVSIGPTIRQMKLASIPVF